MIRFCVTCGLSWYCQLSTKIIRCWIYWIYRHAASYLSSSFHVRTALSSCQCVARYHYGTLTSVHSTLHRRHHLSLQYKTRCIFSRNVGGVQSEKYRLLSSLIGNICNGHTAPLSPKRATWHPSTRARAKCGRKWLSLHWAEGPDQIRGTRCHFLTYSHILDILLNSTYIDAAQQPERDFCIHPHLDRWM